jgi:hypothetical protein
MTQEPDDRLDGLLGPSSERLDAPPGAWVAIRRRARRRKAAKLAVVTTAAALVAGGAVPAVLAVRSDTGGNQTLSVASPVKSATNRHPAPAVTPSDTATANPVAPPQSTLRGYRPRSVSFVSQTEGWLWGSHDNGEPGVVAHTTDGGASWSPLPAPPAIATDPRSDGESGIRFANSYDGFVFGSTLYVTHDGGLRWIAFPTPGHIRDLETKRGKLWALVDDCRNGRVICDTVRLYAATVGYPLLQPVEDVPAMTGQSASLALAGTAVSLLVGEHDFWTSPDGVAWHRGENTCGGSPRTGDWDNAIGAWHGNGLVAICGGQPAAGSQEKSAYESTDSGRHWTALPHPPGVAGYIAGVAAGDADHLIVGDPHGGGGWMTTDGGRHWAPVGPSIGFAGFISRRHVVALTSEDVLQPVFRTSADAGRYWHSTSFKR